MSDTYQLTMAGLLRKRAEVTSEIAVLQDRLRSTVAALDHLDATIRIFDPDADLAEPDRRPPPMFSGVRGELTRFILDTLRAASGPMLTVDVAKAVLATRGGNVADRRALTDVARKVGHALLKAKRRGSVASAPVKGGQMTWWVA